MISLICMRLKLCCMCKKHNWTSTTKNLLLQVHLPTLLMVPLCRLLPEMVTHEVEADTLEVLRHGVRR